MINGGSDYIASKKWLLQNYFGLKTEIHPIHLLYHPHFTSPSHLITPTSQHPASSSLYLSHHPHVAPPSHLLPLSLITIFTSSPPHTSITIPLFTTSPHTTCKHLHTSPHHPTPRHHHPPLQQLNTTHRCHPHIEEDAKQHS